MKKQREETTLSLPPGDAPFCQEFSECLCCHNNETRAFCGKAAYLRLLTALFGYDLTKGLTSATSDDKIYWTIRERFRDSENDKVVLATIGSTLQICETLSQKSLLDNEAKTAEAERIAFEKFCGFVRRLYGCDLSGYNKNDIEDFRYHVMAYLKGRTQKERNEEQKTKKSEN